MGFAYALGMIDVLKGKIKFGKFLILAPENPGAATNCGWMIDGVQSNGEFKEVWHYGSNLGLQNEEPPCMQDGVAPQANIPGLVNKRVKIPDSQNKNKGYGESHYHGFYNWIFSIGAGDGYIKPR